MYTETTVYSYVDSVATPNAWFQANIDTILSIYGEDHRLQKEDVLLGEILFQSHRAHGY